MTALKLAEPLVEAVKTKLQKEMPARIAAINEDTTIPPLTPPLGTADDTGYYTSGLTVDPPRQPFYVIAEGPMELGDTGEGAHSLVTATEIRVFIQEADPNREQLGKRLTRQARAVLESVWDSDPKEALAKADGSPLAYRIVPLRTEPGPVYDPDKPGSLFRAWYLVTFLAEQIEG